VVLKSISKVTFIDFTGNFKFEIQIKAKGKKMKLPKDMGNLLHCTHISPANQNSPQCQAVNRSGLGSAS